ncbi:four helix bundle protein [Ekhidna sp.]|uniref:four helix bundle protein n=1 Tax=Ekhidna sp. TaxID=2608089 RepID=UPI003511590B
MRSDKENLIVELSFQFALKIVAFSENLERDKKYVIARQLIKSGTSIGANVRESQNAESKADFIHKLKIAAKEADETEYWLLICQESDSYPNTEDLRSELTSIIKVLSKIIATSKRAKSSNLLISKSSN